MYGTITYSSTLNPTVMQWALLSPAATGLKIPKT